MHFQFSDWSATISDPTSRRLETSRASEFPDATIEEQLGSFGPFAVTVSVAVGSPDQAFISVDGPDLDRAFQGDQGIVFYLDRLDLLNALTVE